MLKELDKMTSLVMEYRETQNPTTLMAVYNSTKPLVYAAIKYYGLLSWPLEILEDIEADCRTFVLVKSIDRFDITRGAKFTTYYFWWLRSHVRARKNFYSLRANILLTPSFYDVFKHMHLELAESEMLGGDALELATLNNLRLLGQIKRELQDCFI